MAEKPKETGVNDQPTWVKLLFRSFWVQFPTDPPSHVWTRCLDPLVIVVAWYFAIDLKSIRLI
jgi:hypothetical protein